MPRIGAEPERRKALVSSAIELIGEHGSLDVSVKQIAAHAGMSSALAFHYFGDKDEIIIATMRHLLRGYSQNSAKLLRSAATPAERLDCIIRANFSPDQFDRKTVAAWLVFYLHAHSSKGAARLLAIYRSRLRSNLVDALRIFTDQQNAERAAEGLGALIDGIYIRQALRPKGPDAGEAIALCTDYVSAQMLQFSNKENLT